MIYLCDFDDSFTLNIYADLSLLGFEVSVVTKKNIPELFNKLRNEKKRTCIVLGPGPGHPLQYSFVIKELKLLMENNNLYFYGICLGHQLLSCVFELEVEKAIKPIHGQRVKIKLTPDLRDTFCFLTKEIIVQRYNSLAVLKKQENLLKLNSLNFKFFFHSGELMGFKGDNFCSFQFHPESVGTSFRAQFFGVLREFKA